MSGVLRAKVGGVWVDISSGSPGPPGPAGGTYTHVQSTAAAVWTITHGLGYRPNVTVVDSTGRQVEGDVVYSGSDVIVSFSSAFAGTAYLS